MRWLVTGAAGFIGSNLSARLIEQGDEVIGFDNFFTGTRANVDRLQAQGNDRFRFVEADIRDKRSFEKALDGVANVVHLAAQVSVQRSIDDPEETHEINVSGFLTALRSSAQAGARRFVYASSCAVYGDNPSLPLGEHARPAPLSPYAASKLENEVIAAGLQVVHPDLSMTGLRFFNIFGPWQNISGGYAAVIPKWTASMLSGQRPIMYGDGTATRDFCYVGNVCDAITAATQGETVRRPAVFNIGTGIATSLLDLHKAICDAIKAAGRDAEFGSPQSQPWRPGDIKHSAADISAAGTSIGFAPKIDLGAGLRLLLSEDGALLQLPQDGRHGARVEENT